MKVKTFKTLTPLEHAIILLPIKLLVTTIDKQPIGTTS